MIEASRRGFIAGLAGLIVAAPAIVRVTSLMPVKSSLIPVKNTLLDLDRVTRENVQLFRSSNNKFLQQNDWMLSVEGPPPKELREFVVVDDAADAAYAAGVGGLCARSVEAPTKSV